MSLVQYVGYGPEHVRSDGRKAVLGPQKPHFAGTGPRDKYGDGWHMYSTRQALQHVISDSQEENLGSTHRVMDSLCLRAHFLGDGCRNEKRVRRRAS